VTTRLIPRVFMALLLTLKLHHAYIAVSVMSVCIL